MISTSDFRNGVIFEHEGAIHQVVWFQHHKPGKGGAMMRCKLKNLRNGAIIERTFKSGEKFQDMDLTRKPKQFLYGEGEELHFMDMETFEQMTVPKSLLGKTAEFLRENMEVNALYLGEEVLSVELPASVALKVTSTVPGIKGDSVSNMVKPATLETGIELNVPLFIKEGDVIKVDTRTGEYVERV
jgi:elongation factor P